MESTEALERGREAVRRREWGEAFRCLAVADRDAPLAGADLEALATAAHLVGKDAECAELLLRAHQGFLSAGEAIAAARCAVWLAFGAFTRGEPAQGTGWLARAQRLLEGGGQDCVERGWLRQLGAMFAFETGDHAAAEGEFVEAGAIGARFGDRTLVAMSLHGQGRSRIRRGDPARGGALLDESMIAVRAGEVASRIVGGLYCSALEACRELLDVRRAREWTDALERWCAAEPDVVPYRGFCLVYRAELLSLQGAWPEALAQAQQACEWLARPRPGPALGGALEVVGDLRRLRGDFPAAEDAYREARRWQRAPRPGLALLRLAQGQVEAARGAIREVAAAGQGGGRPAVLDACAEIALAAGDVAAARAAADELAAFAARMRTPVVTALAGRAAAAVLLAEGDASGALAAAREALATWRELDAPYEAARAQVLLARACRADGSPEVAELELSAARRAFEQLGAGPDLARLDALRRRTGAPAPGGLTAREVQVLALVASGRTNKAIAAQLGLSEKTVARHLSNIFTKLDLGSRAAATAYAFRHDLV